MAYKSTFFRNSILLYTSAILFFFYGCGYDSKKLKVTIEEKAGVSRPLEYVQVALHDWSQSVVALREIGSNTTILGQRLQRPAQQNGDSYYLFPISIVAHGKKVFAVEVSEKESITSDLKISGQGMDLLIENKHFKADFSIPKNNPEIGLYPGQLSSLFLKKKQVLLERDENDIHWSPNFQKATGDYKTMGHLNNEQAQIVENNPYCFTVEKKGQVAGYEEIDLVGQYTIYSQQPYILYSSTMEMNKDVALRLLRNDEITTNKTFTHVIYPDEFGNENYIPLYDEKQIDSLSKSPLKDNLDWVGFVNKDHGYGLISIRLAYDNSNLTGGQSPLLEPHTKISLGANEGRYWNRILINDSITRVPQKSRYHEQNVYLTIDDLKGIKEQIEMYKNSLQHPLEVSLETE